MFRNLEAEQARLGLSNESMAEYLGISRVAYENKKKTGKFKYIEIKKLLLLCNSQFEYLFAETKETAWGGEEYGRHMDRLRQEQCNS